MNVSVNSFNYKNYHIKNLYLTFPGEFSCDYVYFKKLKIEEINGYLNSFKKGKINFLFYDGKGKINYTGGEFFKGNFLIDGLNIEKLVKKLSEEIYISGIFNISGNFELEDNNYKLESKIVSVRRRRIKQIMNFSAVKFFTTLAGGNPIKMVGSSNFYYGKVGMKIMVKNNRLTIEGLLGEKNGKQFIIKGRFLRNSINLTIDKNSNTINISDLKKRIKTAIRRTKTGAKVSY